MAAPFLVLLAISAVLGAYSPCGTILDLNDFDVFQVTNSSVGPLPTWTVSVWFYPDFSGHCGTFGREYVPFSAGDTCLASFAMFAYGTPDYPTTPYAQLYADACGGGSSIGEALSTSFFDKWHNWIFSFNNGTGYSYFDGVYRPDLNFGTETLPTVNFTIITIGAQANPSTNNWFLSSSYAQIGVWDYSADYCDVQLIYNGLPNMTAAPPVAFYPGDLTDGYLQDIISGNNMVFFNDDKKRSVHSTQATTRTVPCDANTPYTPGPLCGGPAEPEPEPEPEPAPSNEPEPEPEPSPAEQCPAPRTPADQDGCCSSGSFLVPAISMLFLGLLSFV